MEVQTARPPSGSSSGSGSSSAPYPRWVILEKHCEVDASSCPTAAAETLAAARTSDGHPIHVSLGLQDPPATSAVCVELPDGVSCKYCITMAAHGGSLLIEVMVDPNPWHGRMPSPPDNFVYDVGDAAADPPRPPSLLLLPHNHPHSGSGPVNCGRCGLRTDCTGILMRRPGPGEDEVVVAELQMVAVKNKDDDDTGNTEVAELLVFSSGEWSVKRPRICRYGDDELVELPSRWNSTGVFTVGDTTLCWADTSDGGGILLWDVTEESPASPKLHYVPLPTDLPSPCLGRKVCAGAAAAAGGGTIIRLVNIFPRCCCGGAGASKCERSHHAYTINTWALRTDDGDGIAMAEWVMDGMVDATELWPLDAYEGLPRVPLSYPAVSMYEPHVICFALCEGYHVIRGGDDTLWLLTVDMRSKTIRSVSCQPNGVCGSYLMTSNVSYYLNPYRTCSSGDGGVSRTTTGQIHTGQMHVEKEKREDNNVANLMLQSPCKSDEEPPTAPTQASSDEILAAIREIPSYGLAHDDMLRAFLILSGDNGSRVVRSLLRLPKNLRKDWLLMETKADDAY